MKKMKLALSCMMLLMLYIGPSLFAMSSCSVPILAEPNMSKDFSLATEYEASEQSIISFTETLEEEDDVLFYPDAFTMDEMTATSSNQSQYHILDEVDGTWWELFPILLYFDVSDLMIDSIGYNLLSRVPSGALSVFNHTSDSWDVVIATLANGWNNGTLSDDYLPTGGDYNIEVLLSGSLSVDYFGIALSIMTLADSGHYAESFSDVSDWVIGSGEGNDAISTDGDVLTWIIENNGNPNTDYLYCNTPSLPSGTYYFEYRYRMNYTAPNGPAISFYTCTGDYGSGVATLRDTDLTRTTTSTTVKDVVTFTAITESIYFQAYMTTHPDGEVYFDYLRISPSNEMGWQHDGSTTQGISGTATYSTDGDKLNISAIGTTQYIDVVMDTTTTATAISTPYYPFLSFSITDIEDNDANNEVWFVRCYDTGSTHLVDYGSYSDLTGIFRMNLRASTLNDLAIVRFYCRSGDSYTIDFTKAYSIANFTVTKGSSTAVSDILYCDSGILHSSITSGANRYFVIDHDPTLSITESIWNVSTSTVDPELWFYDYVGGWSAPTVDETSGFLTSGTVTDFKLLLDATITIFTISFLSPLPDWHEAGEAVIIFAVLFDEWALDMGLIFLGLFLIPASTIYMAKGGLKEASMTKVFFALVAFILGWAFFIGGIM